MVTSEDATVVAPNDDGAVVNFPVSATDNQDPAPVITCVPQGPGSVFPVGITVVECIATDASGNVSEPSFSEITVTGALLQYTTEGTCFYVVAMSRLPRLGAPCCSHELSDYAPVLQVSAESRHLRMTPLSCQSKRSALS